ncbi:MAG: tetratricopeptide repeat protein [Nitrosomonadales bacterium]|nr:tetratricopeptide repeat protein [Nitrosomonadales bacterium]
MERISSFFVAVLLLALAGCAGAPKQPTAALPMPGEPVPAETVVLPGGEVVEPGPMISANKAVIALLERARRDEAAGKREAAGAALERALRIEPRNAWLWHELARLRLTQGQYAQAITLARKSNSFAGRERRVQALNWKVIADARIAQGDSTGAEQALKVAAELERPVLE